MNTPTSHTHTGVAARPIVLQSNQPTGRFYQGGGQISQFRSSPPSPPHTPEDWVASVTSVRNDPGVGMTRLDHGELLADAVTRSPLSWLGPEHVARFGSDTRLLVKLLDAGQRLPVHAHPDSTFAAAFLGAAHGKAEAWYILEPGTVHLGLRNDIGRAEVADIVARQDTVELLARMHAVEVHRNDTVFVPPGLLHAIGSGVLLAEVQEPEDLSILLEWDGFEIDGSIDGHLGLGFDTAFDAVELTGRSDADIESLVRRDVGAGDALADGAAPFFRLDSVLPGNPTTAELPAGFAVLIAVEGPATLRWNDEAIELVRGMTVLVPFAAGPLRLDGDGRVLVARPPLP
ncbi:class I mannose-6-phosphate isomerase [uncultured Microbacterium sp.]|uniref:class I mannose-6-phosphate isomerase n=1 Tax=uncultured Microbacterium sp. TaxID=191216 RepID=UPI0035C9B786